ncbi:MAG TPA: hypothetical protein DFL85_00970 [Lentisphaeria bacterium]|nr:hypothetical protein [Lentisphaeria bacterium]
MQSTLARHRLGDIAIGDSATYENSSYEKKYFYVDFSGGTDLEFDNELVSLSDITLHAASFSGEEQAYVVAALNELFADGSIVFTAELPEDAGSYSTIYVGSTDAFDSYGLFRGISETIDVGNRIDDDNAFVLINHIRGGIDEVVSVVAHEAGHLLGESHETGNGTIYDYADAGVNDDTASPGADKYVYALLEWGVYRLTFAEGDYSSNVLSFMVATMNASVSGSTFVIPGYRMVEVGTTRVGSEWGVKAADMEFVFSNVSDGIYIWDAAIRTVTLTVGSTETKLFVGKLDGSVVTGIETIYAGNGGTGTEKSAYKGDSGTIGTLYGGGRSGSHIAGSELTLAGGDYANVYGGGDGTSGSSRVGHTHFYGSPEGGTLSVGNLFGGGKGAGAAVYGEASYTDNGITYQAGTFMSLGTGTYQYIYGGGDNGAAVDKNTLVIVWSATVTGSIFGGGRNANVGGSTYLVLRNSNLNGAVIYGGGDGGAVGQNTSVSVTVNIDNAAVYGGGRGAGGTVAGNTLVTLSGDRSFSGAIYGGGKDGAKVNGGTTVELVEGQMNFSGTIYAGGDNADVQGGTLLHLKQSTIAAAGWQLFGGGSSGKVGGKATVLLDAAGGFSAAIYGGGNGTGATVAGTEVTLSRSLSSGTVYGGGKNGATVTGDTKVTVTGSAPKYDVYGGGDASDVGGSTNVLVDASKLTGNVYGGGKNGNVSSGTYVRINAGNDAWGGLTGDVHGGGSNGRVGGKAEIFLDYGNIEGNIYGGGTGSASVVAGGTLINLDNAGAVVSGGIYGGGRDGAVVSGGAVVNILNGSVTDVYGGGKNSLVEGDTTLTLTGGNITGEAFAGGNGGNVTGNARLVLNTTVDGDIYGGGRNGDVYGSTALEINADFKGDIYGGGSGGDVFGKISIALTAGCAAADKFIYAGGTGDVNTAAGTGDAITVTIDSPAYGSAYNIVLGTRNGSGAGGNSTIYGDIRLNLIRNGAASGAASGRIYMGGYRTVSGTTTVTGKAYLSIGAVTLSGILFAGGYASGSGAVVTIEGGSVLTLNGTDTSGFTMLGGYATGAGAHSEIGTSSNNAGVSLTVSGGSRLGSITGGGYAVSGGSATVYGDAAITISDAARVGMIYGGGYALGGTAVNTGRTDISVNGGNAQLNYIYGGGYAGADSTSTLIGGAAIRLTNYTRGDIGIYGGGRSQSNGTVIVGNSGMSEKGAVVTIDGTTSVLTVAGGGAAFGTGSTTVYGGTSITINGGSVSGKLYGGGHAADGGASYVYGDTEIVINGGTFGHIFGGGITTGSGVSIVNGSTGITLNCSGANVITTNSVYAGGSNNATVTGDASITITGLGSNLVFSTGAFVVGGAPSNQGGGVGGTRTLNLTGFTGTITATLAYFDTVTVSADSAVHLSSNHGGYLSGVAEWNFGLADGRTALTWDSGNGGFAGDTFNLNFNTDGFRSATVIAGGSANVINGWNNLSNTVFFNGTTGAWDSDLNAWVDSDRKWQFGIVGDNTLGVSKIV